MEILFDGEIQHTIMISGSAGPEPVEINGTLCEQAECRVDRIVEARVPLELVDVELGGDAQACRGAGPRGASHRALARVGLSAGRGSQS
jgi:hypothetical protein